MQLPIVNHPDYVAKINDDNKFPIKKFGALAKHLLKNRVVKHFHIPKECSNRNFEDIPFSKIYQRYKEQNT